LIPLKGQFLRATIFKDDKMQAALEHLKSLVDKEERLVIAVTYSTTQQTAQAVRRTEQKLEASAKAIDEMRSLQKGLSLYKQIPHD
jgi:cyanate lyase